MTDRTNWQRHETHSGAVYLLSEAPDWFIPTTAADKTIQTLLAGRKPSSIAEQLLFNQLERKPAQTYRGRHHHLGLKKLKELWFHLTNSCNLSCKHCLFESGPKNTEQLNRDDLDRILSEAYQLGCRLYYFTGGEPFVYPDFTEIIQNILTDEQTHVVVLTNGLLLARYLSELQHIDPARFHLQISLDGQSENHDRLRGKGTYQQTIKNIELAILAGFGLTLSMAIHRDNLDDMSDLVRLAGRKGVKNVHFLYHFIRGKGSADQHVAPLAILPKLIEAQEIAQGLDVTIDNIETLKAQVFATPGTRFDLSNSGWESMAVSPDAHIYPSPALVGLTKLDCGSADQGLEHIWRNSSVLDEIRRATIAGSGYDRNPFKFLIGGGDIDHSYLTGGEFTGHDPYVELYNGLALWLISRKGSEYPDKGEHIKLKMGDVRFDCPDGNEVALTHCNCVIALADDRGRASVREFYGQAAQTTNSDIINPFAEGQKEADFIPETVKQHSYGCGSPVQHAELRSSETLVDLGSGSGIECFMAAEMVGEKGRVFGIDMTTEMLHLARTSAPKVAQKLGYANVEFKRGFLEDIPLADNETDAVISNCVINLSPDKRRVLLEVFRILKPGGRLVVSDIVTDKPIPVSIKNDDTLRGECLGGAMLQEDLLAMLQATGFTSVELIKRFHYRQIDETRFYSLTFRAWKPKENETVEVIYRGPFTAIHTENRILFKGRRSTIETDAAQALGESVFIVDDQGNVTNSEMASDCCAAQPLASLTNSCCGSEPDPDPAGSCCSEPNAQRHERDCMVCGNVLTYETTTQTASCSYCGKKGTTNIICAKGHFICDSCHQEEGLLVIRQICLSTDKQDMISLIKEIRDEQSVPMHGPEHHAMLPGVILASAKNSGLPVTQDDILTGISRGAKVPGGSCGFMGNCGAAIGAGIAFAVLLESTPLTPAARQKAQGATARILTRIAEMKAGRCCQRETYIALRETAEISKDILPIPLTADELLACSQYHLNRECVRKQCPLWETRVRNESSAILPMAF